VRSRTNRRGKVRRSISTSFCADKASVEGEEGVRMEFKLILQYEKINWPEVGGSLCFGKCGYIWKKVKPRE